MGTQLALDSPGVTLANAVAALALRRLRSRLVGAGCETALVPCFLDDHPRVVGEILGRAVHLSFLAFEIALRGKPIWTRIADGLPRDSSDLFLQQTQSIRDTLIRAGLGGEDVDAAIDVARSLADLRRAGAFRGALKERTAFAPRSAGSENEHREAAQIEPVFEELKRAGHAPLIDLLGLCSGFGELLVVGLVDYFLCRGVQADSVLGADFVYEHLQQLDELWKDDIAVFARVVDQQIEKIEAGLDGDKKLAGPGPEIEPAEDEALEQAFQRGLDCYLAADYLGAVGHFSAALRHDPENFPLYSYRGDAYRLLCDFDRALADYDAALKLDGTSAPVLVQRATVHRLKGDARQAIADASAAIELDGRYCAAFMTRADAQAESALYDQAVADYTVACQLQPENLWAFFGRGKVLLATKNFDAAIDDFNRVLNLNPHYVLALLHRADARREKGHFGQAIVDYTEVIRIHPRNQLAYRSRAQACERRGDPDRAIADFTVALQLDAGDAVALSSRGGIYRRKGDLKRALADLNQALRCAPDNAAAYYQRGLLHLARGQGKEALADMNEAVNRNPALVNGYLGRALVYDRLGQYPEGIQNCGRALQLNRQFGAAHLIRGVISSHAGHYAKAIADLTKAIALDAKLLLTYQERGMAYLLAGEHERALIDFSHLIEMDPNQALAYATRGTVRQLRGEHEAAMADFSQALHLDPKSMLTGWHGAMADNARNETTRILADYIEGIRPKLPPARPRPKVNGTAVAHDSNRVVAPDAKPNLTNGAAVAHDSNRVVAPKHKNGKAAPTMTSIKQSQSPQERIAEIAPTDVEVLDDAPSFDNEKADPVNTTPHAVSVAPTQEMSAIEEPASEVLEIHDAAALLLATEPAGETKVSAAATSSTNKVDQPPIACPMCHRSANPYVKLPDGRVQCGNCQAMFLPVGTGPSGARANPLPAPSRTTAKARPQKAKDSDDEYEPLFTTKQKAGMGAAAGVLALFLLYCFLPSFGDASGDGPPVAAAIGAEQLLKDFSANRLDAAKKYSAGHIIVTGEVAEIYRDKRPRIRFKAEDRSKYFVEAVFPHVNDLKEIEKNKKVTVRGECEGWQKNQVVEISLCKVVPEPAAQ